MLALLKCGFSAAEALDMPEAEASAYLELLSSFHEGGRQNRGEKRKTYVVRQK